MLWKLETVSGKQTKVPYQPSGRKAMANNPATVPARAITSLLGDPQSGDNLEAADKRPPIPNDVDMLLRQENIECYLAVQYEPQIPSIHEKNALIRTPHQAFEAILRVAFKRDEECLSVAAKGADCSVAQF